MSAPRATLRRVALALAVSTVMVVLIATLVPRAFLVNDDTGLTIYVRNGAYAPWLSPILNRALNAMYAAEPDMPWYGLYLYALIIATGAVLIHTCLELVDERPGIGRTATLLGAMMLIASHAILAVGVTWTTVSISALGTALVSFVAHVELCRVAGRPASRVRALVHGLLFVAGFTLRQEALGAIAAALLPLLGWAAVRVVRNRHLPRPTAVLAFVAPFALAVVVQNRLPPIHGAEFQEFNDLRGQIHGAAAYTDLDTRAPELLQRAGWTVEEYVDFANWRLLDDTEFSADKVRRLVDTGGVPTPFTAAEGWAVLRGVVADSPASVWLFLTGIAGGVVLAWLRVIDRRRAIAFCVIDLVFLSAVPIAMSAVARFPQRVSLSFFTVGAFAIFVVLACEIASRPAGPEAPATSDRRASIGLLVIALCMFLWARNLFAWMDRPAWPYHPTLAEFADRVTARNGFVIASPIGTTEMDPLLVDPRGYDALPAGWGTFTGLWHDYIARFGMRSGAEVLGRMVDNPDSYFVSMPYGHEEFVRWVRRRIRNPDVRLSLVDTAMGMPTELRPELYRLVTTPLVRDSHEWRQLARNERESYRERPGPPQRIDATFRTVAFAPPYEQHASTLRHPAEGTIVAAIDGGVRSTAPGVSRDACTARGEVRAYAGIRVPVEGLVAAQFELALIDAENILGFYVFAQAPNGRAMRWGWDLDHAAQQFGFTGAVTLVAGYPAHQLELTSASASAREIRDLHLFVAVRPGTHAGFEVRRLEVAEP